ncbi:MAG: NUDIX hydrolase [Thermoproteota archaeon]|nr:NUDIX hydrolase [Thermoproteota archaeon]
MNNIQYKNPIPTVDTIIQKNSQILFVQRKKEPFKGYLVFPGGFVNEGEKVEDAAIREVKEETSLDIELVEILGVYSDPIRDPRGHIMSTVFIGKPSRDIKVEAIAGDDAASLQWRDSETIDRERLGFDHNKILLDYEKWKQSRGTYWSSKVKE